MYVTVDLQQIFYTSYVAVFTVYLRAKFHIPSSSATIIIVIKLKAKQKFTRSPCLYLRTTEFYLSHFCIYVQDLMPNTVSPSCIQCLYCHSRHTNSRSRHIVIIITKTVITTTLKWAVIAKLAHQVS